MVLMSQNIIVRAISSLRTAERIAFSVGLIAIVINLVMIWQKGVLIDWPAYINLTVGTSVLLAIGLYYRLSARSERIASAMICTAGVIFFTMALSVYNYLLLPITRPTIDIQIAQIDALFGYHWPSVMQWAAEHPVINFVLKCAYVTTMPQLAVLTVLLGLSGRHKDLHVMVLAIVISATLAICFWGLFPTLGAKSLHEIPQDVWLAVAPVVDQSYTLELKRIAIEGPGFITPDEIRGLIAFPSYHSALAFIALISARNLKYLFPIFLVTNLLILPATFIHGGHHLLDPFAGFALFYLAYRLAKSIVSIDHERRQIPEIVTA